MAALAFPVAGIAGWGAKVGADSISKIPASLDISAPAQASYVYASDGKTLITTFYDEARRFVPLSDVAPAMQQAIISAEDSRFFEHHGVDVKGVLRAFVANHRSGQVQQGASTLTMQYVRNLLLASADNPEEALAATQQTTSRKLREMRMAVQLEQKLNKQQILEGYLNIAYFGHRAYGIYAASRVYFSRDPSQLTVPQAAMLAGLVQAPSSYDPADPANRKVATDRRNWVIDRMVSLDYLSAPAAAVAKASPITLRLGSLPNNCASVSAAHNDYGFFCDFFHEWWLQQPQFGATEADRENNLRRGGYTIITSLDPAIQRSAESHVLDKVPVTNRFAHGVVVVEPGTGKVKAMAVNRVYSLDQSHNLMSSDPAKARYNIRGNYPDTVVPLLGGGDMSGYQAGSTFKMFTMLAALSQGLPLSTTIYAPPRVRTQYVIDPSDPAACGGPYWCPQNASGAMTGYQSIWSGFGKSVNTFFAQLIERVGSQNAVAMAEKLGLQWRNPVDQFFASPAHSWGWGAFTLGVADTTPLEMADAYATVAAQGKYCAPMAVQEVRDNQGRVVPVSPRCNQVVPVEAARGAADAARCVTGYGASKGQCGGWSTAPSVYPTVGRPVAGKTGTTDTTRAAWFIGFTPNLAAASFMADPDNPSDAVGDQNSRKPVDTVAQTLHDALQGTPVLYFTPPSDRTAYGKNGRSGYLSSPALSQAAPQSNQNNQGGGVTTATLPRRRRRG